VIKFQDCEPRAARQFHPAILAKWGVKIYGIVDSSNLYLLNFDVYVGVKETIELQGDTVVKSLVEPYYNKFHNVYFQHPLTSVPLVEHLLANNTYSCSLVNKSQKGLPKEIKKSKLKTTGNIIKKQKGDLFVVTWYDRSEGNQVTILSTVNNTGNTTITKREKHGRPSTTCQKPIAMCEFDKHYYGVGISDEQRVSHGNAQRANTFWKYMFWFILDTCLTNAFILYKEAPRSPQPKLLNLVDFQLKVSSDLIGKFSSRKRKDEI
jgi:hypothetical protein